MVKQGDIIKVSLDPRLGHEQAEYRPAVVVSYNFFNQKTNLVLVCPITNTNNKFPLHIPPDDRNKTTGVVLCEHIRSLDLGACSHTVVENIPDDLLKKIINIIFAEIEQV